MVLSEQFEAESDAEVCGAPVGAAASEGTAGTSVFDIM